MKPKLRELAVLEMRSALNGFMLKQIERPDIYPFQSCLYCENFNENSELCNLWNAKPPARIILNGCDKFEDKEQIPF